MFGEALKQISQEPEAAETDVQDGEARFRHLVDNAPDIIARFDENHRYIYVNAAAERALGIPREAFIGRTNPEIGVPEPALTRWQESLAEVWESGEEQVIEFHFPNPDGPTYFESHLAPEFAQDGSITSVLSITRDITARKQAEQTLQRRNTEVQLLYETGKQLGRTLELEATFDVVYDLVSQIMPCTTLVVSRYTPEDKLIHCVYVRHEGRRQDVSGFPTIPLEPEGVGTQSRAIRSGEALMLNNFAEEMARNRTAYHIDDAGNVLSPSDLSEDEDKTESALIVPLKLEGSVTGVLQVLSKKQDAFTEGDLQLLDALGPQIAAATSNALLYRQAQKEIAQRRRAQEELRERELLYRTLVKTSPLAILLANAEGEILVLNEQVLEVSGYAQREEIIGKKLTDFLVPSEVERATEHMARVRRGETLRDVPYTILHADGRQIPVEISASPLGDVRGKLRGLIVVIRDVTEQKAAEAAEREQRALAEALADTAAILNRTLDLDEVLDRILDNVGRVVPYDGANIMLIEDEMAHVRRFQGYYEEHGISPHLVDFGFRVEDTSTLHKMATTHNALVIPDTGTHPLWTEVPENDWIGSYVGAPIIQDERVIGFLNLDAASPGFFTPEHGARLQAFASHAAIALQNAQLYEALEHHSDFLESAVAARTAELQQTVDKVDAILSHSPQAIMLLGADGHIETGNPAVETLFGYSVDEVRQQEPHILIRPEDQQLLTGALQATLLEGKSQRLQLLARRKDGTIFDTDVALAPIQDNDAVVSVVCSMHDISGLKEVERMKDAFVSNVSHELRTPISSLKLYHGLIGRDSDRRPVYMQRMEREIDRLSVTIEDLLRLSRLEQEQVQLKKKPLDLADLVRQHVVDRSPLAEKNELTLVQEQSTGPAMVTADEGLIGQVLSILLTNALTYTPAGGSIHVGTCSQQRDDENWTGFYVRDTGPGIPAEEHSDLFRRFYRGKVGRRSGAAGTGLGLSIAQEIVQQHGGWITIESKEETGEGATFTVWLPSRQQYNGGE